MTTENDTDGPRTHAPELLARAGQPGRVRGIGLEIWRAARARPRDAGGVLRHGLRDARALHSRERRLVSDLLYDLVRHGALIAAAVGSDDDEALWDAALALRGAPETVAPDLAAPLRGREADDALALRAGVPLAVAQSLRRAFGDEAEAFVTASGTRAPVCLRPHPADAARLAGELARQQIPARAGQLWPSAVVLPPGTPTHTLRSRVEVQDEASQWVASLCGVRPGETVLDACAGAGGKALALAAAGARVTAVDVRAPALEELRRRAQTHGVRVRAEHRASGSFAGLGAFDVVLVDAPCSGTGTWRRHPELRWRLDDVGAMTALQAQILDAAVAALKPGGRLVYATCSVLPEEDEAQAVALGARHPSLRPLALEPGSGSVTADRGAGGVGLRTAPHRQGTDGFFVAAWERAG
jgi:16S rRNA (cytosine967-C5)-methyltransferase